MIIRVTSVIMLLENSMGNPWLLLGLPVPISIRTQTLFVGMGFSHGYNQWQMSYGLPVDLWVLNNFVDIFRLLEAWTYIVITHGLLDPNLPGLFRLVQAYKARQATSWPAHRIFLKSLIFLLILMPKRTKFWIHLLSNLSCDLSKSRKAGQAGQGNHGISRCTRPWFGIAAAAMPMIV